MDDGHWFATDVPPLQGGRRQVAFFCFTGCAGAAFLDALQRLSTGMWAVGRYSFPKSM